MGQKSFSTRSARSAQLSSLVTPHHPPPFHLVRRGLRLEEEYPHSACFLSLCEVDPTSDIFVSSRDGPLALQVERAFSIASHRFSDQQYSTGTDRSSLSFEVYYNEKERRKEVLREEERAHRAMHRAENARKAPRGQRRRRSATIVLTLWVIKDLGKLFFSPSQERNATRSNRDPLGYHIFIPWSIAFVYMHWWGRGGGAAKSRSGKKS